MDKTKERFSKEKRNKELEHVNLVKSTFYNEDDTKRKLVDFILNTEILSMNVKCLEFESKYADYMGQKYSVLFNSGSSANLALVQVFLNLGYIKKGDKVAFSSLTWATNVMPLLQLGLIPIPVDVELDTLNVCSREFAKVLEAHPDIKLFFLSNILGFCDDIDNIKNMCEDKDVYFIEDNCESIGSECKGQKLGSFGVASSMSLYVGHHLSSIEGGIVSTDDDDIYNMLQIVRSHGWNRCLDETIKNKLQRDHHVDEFYDKYTFYDLGYNLRPTEITGFLAIEALEYIEPIIRKREENFWKFYDIIKNKEDAVQLRIDHLDVISNFAFPLIFKDKDKCDALKNQFLDAEIEIRPIVGGNIVNQPFFKKYMDSNYNLPNSNRIHANGFYFPNNPELTDDEILRILTLLKSLD